MTYEQLKQQKELILLDCISGSTAYNLNVPGSDVDKKGIFIMPQKQLYGFEQQEQIANASNDEVYFEIGRFLELLTKNNPNILSC
ncbi:MAG TPA: nucleotidyltransferase domain-containing protein [Mucilaginibacter sp.]|nr:nucleotidyltransferase domain-containing protein [Mucilaginibacter sp.]